MHRASRQALTVAQMQAAEQALVDGGIPIDELMQRAGRGAAEYAWRMAAGNPVTILCGPGNNGGDGYVIAEVLRERGLPVTVVAPADPTTAAARHARSLYLGDVTTDGSRAHGQLLVDCLFGSGLSRGLSPDLAGLLEGLASRHHVRMAVDLPSGVESDSGAVLSPGPRYDATIALGAWKYAHFLMPARTNMGALRLVDIGVAEVSGAARVAGKPRLSAPGADAHKYRRGLLALVGGAMPGASLLAARAAMQGGAGYVKLLSGGDARAPVDLVVDGSPLAEALSDRRIAAVLVGPGLGRDAIARARLSAALQADRPVVMDADALIISEKQDFAGNTSSIIVTPHEGELVALERLFELARSADKPARARALAKASGAVVVAKGPDTVVAAPDGSLRLVPPAPSWLSTAGTGDVLAGAIASRLATGRDPLVAALEGLALHGEAARIAGPALTASQLAGSISAAYAALL